MTTTSSVTTDLSDYAPGAAAIITASGLDAGSAVTFDVQHVSGPGVDGVYGTADDVIVSLGGDGHDPWVITDGGEGDLDHEVNGTIVTTWYVDPDDSLDATFLLSAIANDGAVAFNTFTDAAGSINKVYQHWADVGTGDWNNNILSDVKSDYFEGEVVPHVFVYKASNNAPLVNGQSYSFNITYNYYQQSSNAGGFVYITSYNESRAPGQLSATTPYIAPTIDSSFVNGGGMHSGGSFYTVDANITSVSGINNLGSGNIDQQVKVTGATTTSGIAEIFYGLYIAQPGEVVMGSTPTNGASAWTGGSLQTTVDIGGSGASSIQLAPPAIIKGTISGFKFEDLNGNGVWDTGTEKGLANWTIFLDTNNNGNLDSGETSTLTAADGSYSFSVIPDADLTTIGIQPYYVREVQKTGWTQTTSNPAAITISATDPTEANVNFGNQPQLPALSIDKAFVNVTGGNGNDVADAAGDVLNYTVTVKNTGNVTLTNVVVTDPLTKLSQTIDSLAAGASQTFDASYTLTQSDLDTKGGGDGDVDNTAKADSDQTDPVSDSAEVALVFGPEILIDKVTTVGSVTGDDITVPAGQSVTWTYTVKNTGNVTLSGVTVIDDNGTTSTSDDVKATYQSGDDGNGTLDPEESWVFTLSGTTISGNYANTGSVTATAPDDSSVSASDPSSYFGQAPALSIEKAFVNVTDGNDNDVADAAGDVLHYTVTVTNTGNVALTGVTVQDPLTGQDLSEVTLAVGESKTYNTSYTLTQADLDTQGGGDGDIDNTATAYSDQTGPVSASAEATLVYDPKVTIEKTAVSTEDDGLVNQAGDEIQYTVTVTNTGNVPLANVSVSDPDRCDGDGCAGSRFAGIVEHVRYRVVAGRAMDVHLHACRHAGRAGCPRRRR